MQKNNEIIAGKNCVIETIKAQKKDVNKVFLLKNKRDKEISSLANEFNIPVVYVERDYLNKLAPQTNHQGIVASISPIKYLSLDELIAKHKNDSKCMFLILDEVHDVNNFGAILRICDAFKINGVIINKRRSAPVTSSVAKISTGAVNYVDICRVTNLSQAIKKLKQDNFWIANLDMKGQYLVDEPIYDRQMAVIIGGEDKGVTDIMKKQSDFSISIPMIGHVNSLNVSCATSILCYQHMLDS